MHVGKPGRLRQWLRGWAGGHARAVVASLGRLYRAPMPSALTAGVIGIALALPTGFLLLLTNMTGLTAQWQGTARISLFIHTDIPMERYEALAHELRRDPQVAGTTIITPEAALAEFRRNSGFEDALTLLKDNPLPPVIVVQPKAELDAARLQVLSERLRGLKEVELVQLDRTWIQRLQALMTLIARGVWVIAGMLGAAVVLVVGNTIRLDIQNRRDEIVVVKLLGGSNAFIRRPFLYEGVWYGFGGGLLAAILVELGHLLLSGPARELALLYGSTFSLEGLGFQGLLDLLMTGAALGLFGSWLAVGRHLAAIEPR